MFADARNKNNALHYNSSLKINSSVTINFKRRKTNGNLNHQNKIVQAQEQKQDQSQSQKKSINQKSKASLRISNQRNKN